MTKEKFAFAIHGGAGNIYKNKLGKEKVKAYEAALKEVGQHTQQILQKGASAMDAVLNAVMLMEDNPLFNAGKGAVFNAAGKQEMDASIMNGETMQAGAVAGVSRIKNPVAAAKLIMEKSPHVFLIGKGAEDFVRKNGMPLVNTSYFYSKKRKMQQQKAQAQGKTDLDHNVHIDEKDKHGTVGAVAFDKQGHLAAATSTGGMTNKIPGRIGDSPIIGAGTYACDIVAISCTGHGEPFIRYVAAYELVALMRYKKLSLQAASELLINEKFKSLDIEGGLIAVDKNGNISLPFNTPGMFRSWGNEDTLRVGIS